MRMTRLLTRLAAASSRLQLGRLHTGARLLAADSAAKLPDNILPFSQFLTDTHGRHHDYLRISISER